MNLSHIGFSQIELLVALVDTGSFSQAASDIGVSQSAVSHGLARLETELGVTLVERGRRGISLTEAGREVLGHAREVLRRLDAIRQAAAAASGGIASGKLRLGIAPPFFPILAAGIVSAFQQQYPETEIALFEGTEAEIASRLKEESLDAALAAPQSGGELDSYLLFQDELCVLVRAGHPLLQKATVTATDLSAEPLIVPMLGRSLAIAMLRGANDGNGRPQIRHLVSDTPTIFALVRAGVGAALLPRSAVPLDASDLSTAALEPPFPITLALLARSWAAASPAALRLRRTAEAWIQQHRSL